MSNNLDLNQVAANQANKETTINTATGQLDAALTEILAKDVTAGNLTLSASEYRRNMAFEVNSTTASRSLTLQVIKKFAVIIAKSTLTQAVDIKLGSTTISLAVGARLIVYTDGTTNGLYKVAEAVAAIPKSYDVATFCVGVTTASEVLMRLAVVRDINLPVNATGSVCNAGVAATAQTDFIVAKNGSTIGTIRFAAAGTTATYVSFVSTNFTSADILTITAPVSPDATLANISFTLKGTQI